MARDDSPDTANIPVIVEDVLVEILGMIGVLKIWADDEFAKVKLASCQFSRL
jgi:hypothetical protein